MVAKLKYVLQTALNTPQAVSKVNIWSYNTKRPHTSTLME